MGSVRKKVRSSEHTKVIRSHDYTVLVLDRNDGGTRHDGCLCRLPRAAVLEVGVVVGAVNIVSGLCLSQNQPVSSTLFMFDMKGDAATASMRERAGRRTRPQACGR